MLMLKGVQTDKPSIEDCKKCIFGNTAGWISHTCDLKYTNFPTKCDTLDESSGEWRTSYFVLEEAQSFKGGISGHTEIENLATGL